MRVVFSVGAEQLFEDPGILIFFVFADMALGNVAVQLIFERVERRKAPSQTPRIGLRGKLFCVQGVSFPFSKWLF